MYTISLSAFLLLLYGHDFKITAASFFRDPGLRSDCSGKNYFESTRPLNAQNELYSDEILNMRDLLKPLTKCLTVILNFRGINILELESPVVLQRFTISALISNCRTTYAPITFSDKAEKNLEKIPLSRLINRTDLSLTLKWTCTVVVNLYYPETWKLYDLERRMWLFLWRREVPLSEHTFGMETKHARAEINSNLIQIYSNEIPTREIDFPYQKISMPVVIIHILLKSLSRVNASTDASKSVTYGIQNMQVNKFTPYLFHILAVTGNISKYTDTPKV